MQLGPTLSRPRVHDDIIRRIPRTKGQSARKTFPFDDVIMNMRYCCHVTPIVSNGSRIWGVTIGRLGGQERKSSYCTREPYFRLHISGLGQIIYGYTGYSQYNTLIANVYYNNGVAKAFEIDSIHYSIPNGFFRKCSHSMINYELTM